MRLLLYFGGASPGRITETVMFNGDNQLVEQTICFNGGLVVYFNRPAAQTGSVWPVQLLPPPAVQPKHCAPNRILLFNRLCRCAVKIVRGLLFSTTGKSSAWLKSQS